MAPADPPDSGSSATAAELPVGIERALARAAQDPAFRKDLQARRGAAAQDAGIELTAAERAVLESIEAQQLDGMVARLEGRLEALADPGASLAPSAPVPGGIRPGAPQSFGIRPDAVQSAGIRPEFVSHGVRPEPPPVQGSRPDLPIVRGSRPGVAIALAAGAVVVGGAGAALLATAGNRPDELPPPQPAEPERGLGESTASGDDGSEPDAGDGGSSTDTP